MKLIFISYLLAFICLFMGRNFKLFISYEINFFKLIFYFLSLSVDYKINFQFLYVYLYGRILKFKSLSINNEINFNFN